MRKRTLLATLTASLFIFGFFLIDWTLIRRALTYPWENEITNFGWYSPTEKVVGCPEQNHAAVAPDPILRPALDEITRYSMDRRTAALLVSQNNQMILEKYGNGFGAELRPNSMSMAKTVLALLIGIAIDEGSISSENEKVSRYIPEWGNDARREIRIKDLLQMTSGLEDEGDSGNPLSYRVRMHVTSNLLGQIFGLQSAKPPGTEFNYNNTNSQIASLLLERATGKRYAHYLSEKLWCKLGAQDAHLWLDKENGTPKSYCCIFARPRDWMRLGQMLLDRGKWNGHQIVPEAWLTKMTTPSQHEAEYGYFTWLGTNRGKFKKEKQERSEDLLDPSVFFLDGRGKQRMFIIPSRKMVVLRLGEYIKDWDDAVLPNTLIRATQR